MFKKTISLILIAALMFTATGCSKKQEVPERKELITTEGKYPTEWQSTNLYANYNAWLKDLESIADYPAKFELFRGKLNTIEGLLGFINLSYDLDYLTTYHKLAAYAYYGTDAFPAESDYQRCLSRFNRYNQGYTNKTAFFEEEMAAMSLEERQNLFNNELLKPYAHIFKNYLKEDSVFLSENETLLANTLSLSHDRMYTLYSLLGYADLPDLEYKLKDGSTVIINDSTLYYYLASDLDQETKLDIYNSWWGHTAEFKNTFAYALETQMLETYARALVNGYESSLAYDMDSYGVNEEIMDILLTAARENADLYERYFKFYANKYTGDKYYSYTNATSLSNYSSDTIQYDEAVDKVIEALSILGDEYIETFEKIVKAGGIDVYMKDDKAGGAFELGGFKDIEPFVLFNYDGSIISTDIIAHEMGHACYDALTMKYQEIQDWDPLIFTHEVASTINELLFYSYMISNAQSDEEKLYYLESEIETWGDSFFRQCFFQEFENYCHEMVESGNILDPDDLAEKWDELSVIYFGEGIDNSEYGAYRWTTLDHLYYGHYVFQYATSICFASAIASRIINNEEGAVENYLEFLKAGYSADPAEVLKIAGIDINDPQSYQDGIDYYSSLLSEFEILLKK